MKSNFLQVHKKYVFAISLIAASSLIYTAAHAQKKSVEVNAYKTNASNPTTQTKEVIIIRNNNGSYGIAKLYLLSGKKCSETVLQSGNNAIDISMLPHGEYIISIMLDGGETFNQKFIKT